MITPDTFYRDLELMLELEPGTVSGNEILEDLYWDSMTLVMFIAMADQEYSITVEAPDLANSKTVAELYSLINSRS